MTDDERVQAVEEWGPFTHRQAFVVTAALHGGVCLQRQYDRFAGIRNGEATRRFFAALVSRKYATAYPCARRRSQIYHLHNRRLYELIGQPNSRFRKRGNVTRALERLVILDAIIATPHLHWLATEREKVAHCIKRHQVPLAELPKVIFGSGPDQTTRYFVNKLPIGVGSLGAITLMYPMLDPNPQAFRSFMEAHRRLLKRLQRWRVLLVGGRSFDTAEKAHLGVLRDFCAAPLPLSLADEFRWYCHTRRTIETGLSTTADEAGRVRYARARRAFSAPRFYLAYRRWCQQGDPSLLDLLYASFHDAWSRDGGVVDTLNLHYTYSHLTPFARGK